MKTDREICNRVVEAILDEAAPRPPGMEAHLGACAACRELRDAHAAALLLGGIAGPAAAPVDAASVVRRARRRRRVRAGAAAVLVAVALALWLPRLAWRGPDRVAPGADFSLAALSSEVWSYTQRDVAREDPVLLAFGELPRWLAPPPSRALDSPPFARPLLPWATPTGESP